MWYRTGDTRARQHEGQHIQDIRTVWNALYGKAVGFTGCCKPKGWSACYQGVAAKYVDYGLKIYKAMSSGRHASNNPLMGYQNPNSRAEQQRLFKSLREQAITALTLARVAEKQCADKFKGPPPKMGGDTNDVDSLLNGITQ